MRVGVSNSYKEEGIGKIQSERGKVKATGEDEVEEYDNTLACKNS